MNTLDLSAKTILITGGAGAIGRVVVQALLDHGAHVLVNDIISDEDAHVILPTHAHLRYVRADTTQADAVTALFDQIEARGALPNVVCCHAGMVEAYPVSTYPLDNYDTLMDVNVRAAFLVAQEAARRWQAQHVPGHLIFTSSWVQDVPWPEITPYTMSKSAMKAMMRGFARELAPVGIRANAIAPGIVGVGLAKRQWDTDPAYKARASKAIPLGHMQPPESVANGFVFLCSDMANYMTGSVLLMDGGCSLYPMD
jgi:NAD(P)-dependent dehydrogenase (short-subunit alcohol dehydrogenase family)